MKYATVCSGIEACSAAWHPLGWQPVFFSEIEKFPSAVLAHHYPSTPNLGDMTKIDGTKYTGSIDLICGGTPCQSFSVAGLRGGLGDERGNLALTFFRLVDQIRPTWVVWENVPGVLSSNKGRDFGSILGALAHIGYGFAYRILDAQFFGVPQRRRRVFVVGHIGGFWQPAATVLFESGGLFGYSTPGGGAREKIAPNTGSGVDAGGWSAQIEPTVMSSGQANAEIRQGQSPTLTCKHEAPIVFQPPIYFTVRGGKEGGGKGYLGIEDKSLTLTGVQHNYFIPSRPVMFPGNWIGRKPENGGNGCEATEISPTLTKMDVPGVAQNSNHSLPVGGHSIDMEYNAKPLDHPLGTLLKGSPTGGGSPLPAIHQNSVVRRITPREAGRLQGFPDDYTAIRGEKTPDGPQYAAYGNSMAVPVMQWIGRRIKLVDSLLTTQHT